MSAEICIGCYTIDAQKAYNSIRVVYERQLCKNGVFPTVCCKYYCDYGYGFGKLKIQLYGEKEDALVTKYVKGDCNYPHIRGSMTLNLNDFDRDGEHNKIILKARIVNTVYNGCLSHFKRMEELSFYFDSVNETTTSMNVVSVINHTYALLAPVFY